MCCYHYIQRGQAFIDSVQVVEANLTKSIVNGVQHA